MLTKFILKISLFATFITFVYCTVTNVAIIESAVRAGTVFAGFYAVLTGFFLTLRMFLSPYEKEKPNALPEAKDDLAAQIENIAKSDNIGVFGE